MYFYCICGKEGDLRILLFRHLAQLHPIFFICLSVDGHSGCFHILAIVNSACNECESTNISSLVIWNDDTYLSTV